MRGRAAVFLFLLLIPTLPASPQCTQTSVFSDPFRQSFLDLAVDGNDLWAATGYGVALFDRGLDPPAPVATLALSGVTRVVRVQGSYVYAGSGSNVVVL